MDNNQSPFNKRCVYFKCWNEGVYVLRDRIIGVRAVHHYVIQSYLVTQDGPDILLEGVNSTDAIKAIDDFDRERQKNGVRNERPRLF